MMPPRTDLGERISSLEAKFDGFEKYMHERWHDLNNTLQPIANLPISVPRDIAKLEGKLEVKINERLSAIEQRLSSIETQRQQLTGAQKLAGVLINIVIAAITALATLFAASKHP